MKHFEPLRDIVEERLSLGSSYAVLAGALNESGHKPPKGGLWTRWSAYNAARRLGLSSQRPCKAQPKAANSLSERSMIRVKSAIRHTLESGAITPLDLRKGAIHPTAKTLGLTSWTWRRYRYGAMRQLALPPPDLEL